MKIISFIAALLIGFSLPADANLQEGVTAFVRGDYGISLRELRPLAEAGDARAEFYLGVMYEKGQGVAKDQAEAAKWYRLAADQGFPPAQTNLGFKYENGSGVAKDEAEAVKWYRKAADRGYTLGQFNLGEMYASGKGVTKDETEAVKWYRLAADQGFPPAQTNLGFMYGRGQGVTIDQVEALKWYRKAADQGDARAQFYLGLRYAQGRGVPKDEVEAVKWYRKAADQGLPIAQFELEVEDAVASSQPATKGNTRHLLDSLQIGKTSRDGAIALLGRPDGHFESFTILTWPLRIEGDNYTVLPQFIRSQEGVTHSLVLVFDQRGVLSERSLVRIVK